MDSGGFTELNLHGTWTGSTEAYARRIRRYQTEIGGLDWVAPRDWMCEPTVLKRTGLSLLAHQRRTVDAYLALCDELGDLAWLIAPVLQGWEEGDYHRCVEMYLRRGVDLSVAPVVGVGSVCRRGGTHDVVRIVSALRERWRLPLHGFGVKGSALVALRESLASADSLAWSFAARQFALDRRLRRRPAPEWVPDCSHRTCSSCEWFAVAWRRRLLCGFTPARQLSRT